MSTEDQSNTDETANAPENPDEPATHDIDDPAEGDQPLQDEKNTGNDNTTPQVDDPETLAPSGSQPKYALVVEDSRIVRRMLVKILKHVGYICDEAENGYEALALLRKAKSCNYSYKVIATDLMMPEMDGWGLIEQLIEKKITPAIPVVVITASATVDSVKRCMSYGIKNFIVKPFQADKVIATIDKVTDPKAKKD